MSGKSDGRISAPQHGSRGAIALGACQLFTIAIVVVWPWLLGGVLDGAGRWLALLTAILLACMVCVIGFRGFRQSIPPVSWAVLLAIGLAAFQLIPLSASTLDKVAPTSAAIWQRFGWTAQQTVSDESPLRTISVSRPDTRASIADLWIAAVFVVAGATFAQRSKMTIALMFALAINGATLTAFGLLQRAFWNGRVYWQIRSPAASAFGPYINHNNAGGYLLICLAGAFGILAWRIQGRIAPSEVASLTLSRRRSFRERISDHVAWLRLTAITLFNDRAFLVAFVLAALMAAGIVITLSRGAFLGLLCGSCCAALVIARRGFRGALPVALMLAVVAFGAVAWLENLSVVRDRLATLMDSNELQSSRVLHLKEAIAMVPEYWTSGCGLGAYRFVNGRYRRNAYEGLFLHVENQYVEALIVGGLFGALLLFACMLMAAHKTWKLSRKPDRFVWAIAVLAAFLFGGQLVAATFDFGWYLPANMIAMATVTGCILAHRDSESRAAPSRRPSLVALALLIGVSFFAVPESLAIAKAKSAVITTPDYAAVERVEPVVDLDTIRAELEQLQADLNARPTHPELLNRLGEKWLRLARGDVFRTLRYETSTEFNRRGLWSFSSLPYLNMSAHSFAREGDEERLRALRTRDELVGRLQPAYDCFRKLASECPLSMDAHYRLSQLGLLVAGDTETWSREMALAMELAPQDAELRWRYGIMQASVGNTEFGCTLIRDSIEMKGELDKQLLMFARFVVAPDDFARLAMPQDAQQILEVVDDQLNSLQRMEYRTAMVTRAEELIESSNLEAYEKWHLQAAIERLRGNMDEAERTIKKGLRRYPRYWELHFEYGRLCEQTGRMEEAEEFYTSCARAHPNSPKYSDSVLRVHKKIRR